MDRHGRHLHFLAFSYSFCDVNLIIKININLFSLSWFFLLIKPFESNCETNSAFIKVFNSLINFIIIAIP